jgi:hypothetical protein
VVLLITPVGPGASLTFALGTISPNMRTVMDLDRETVPESVSRPLTAAAIAAFHAGGFFAHKLAASQAAEHEIRAHARGFDTQVSALLEFATQAHVELPDLLMAMLAGASDSSAGDQLMAGTAYAIATAAGDPIAGDLLAGHFKVDGVLPAQLNAPPLSYNPQVVVIALYATAAGKGGKGDTLYMPTDFDITDVSQRATVIHELQHARDDGAATSESTHQAQLDLEATAFRAEGRYVLEQMLAQAPADRAATAKRLLAQIHELDGLGIIVEAASDRARFAPAMDAITTAAIPEMANDMTALMNIDSTTLEKIFRDRIASTYGLAPDQVMLLDGFVGESILRLPPSGRK